MGATAQKLGSITQRAEWKARTISSIVERSFDSETVEAMIDAAMDEAYSEGLSDAADICETVGLRLEPIGQRIARVLADAIKDLKKLNSAVG